MPWFDEALLPPDTPGMESNSMRMASFLHHDLCNETYFGLILRLAVHAVLYYRAGGVGGDDAIWDHDLRTKTFPRCSRSGKTLEEYPSEPVQSLPSPLAKEDVTGLCFPLHNQSVRTFRLASQIVVWPFLFSVDPAVQWSRQRCIPTQPVRWGGSMEGRHEEESCGTITTRLYPVCREDRPWQQTRSVYVFNNYSNAAARKLRGSPGPAERPGRSGFPCTTHLEL